MPRSLLPASLGAAALLGSCSVMYGDDADAKQCQTPVDCAAFGANLTCNDGVCEVSDAGAQLGPAACKVDGDCTQPNHLCGYDGYCYEKWGCLDQPRDWSPADVNIDFSAMVRRFENIADLTLVGNLQTSACLSTDPRCQAPIVAPGAAQLTAEKKLTVPFRGVAQTGFIGSMLVKQVTTSDAGTADAGVVDDPSVLPAYYHFTSENPLVTSMYSQTELMMVSPAIYPILGATWSVDANPDLATVVLQVHDCGGRKAADVSLTPLGGVSDFLFVAVTAKATPLLGLTKTTEDGAALLLNVPAGGNLIFALRDEAQQRVLSDTITFLARGKALNYFAYYPRRSALTRWMNHARAQGLAQ